MEDPIGPRLFLFMVLGVTGICAGVLYLLCFHVWIRFDAFASAVEHSADGEKTKWTSGRVVGLGMVLRLALVVTAGGLMLLPFVVGEWAGMLTFPTQTRLTAVGVFFVGFAVSLAARLPHVVARSRDYWRQHVCRCPRCGTKNERPRYPHQIGLGRFVWYAHYNGTTYSCRRCGEHLHFHDSAGFRS